jgi:predicted component of type VI protein secretion system
MADVGAFLRIVVEGLQSMLETRSVILEDFGVGLSRHRGAGRRPALGPFRSANEALSSVLLDDSDEYEDGCDAARNAFRKLGLHEQAVANGYIRCLRYVVEEFDPERVLGWSAEHHNLVEGAILSKWAKYERYYRHRAHELMNRNFQASRLGEIFKVEYARTMGRNPRK